MKTTVIASHKGFIAASDDSGSCVFFYLDNSYFPDNNSLLGQFQLRQVVDIGDVLEGDFEDYSSVTFVTNSTKGSELRVGITRVKCTRDEVPQRLIELTSPSPPAKKWWEIWK